MTSFFNEDFALGAIAGVPLTAGSMLLYGNRVTCACSESVQQENAETTFALGGAAGAFLVAHHTHGSFGRGAQASSHIVSHVFSSICGLMRADVIPKLQDPDDPSIIPPIDDNARRWLIGGTMGGLAVDLAVTWFFNQQAGQAAGNLAAFTICSFATRP